MILWYILLDKLPVLLALYKSAGPDKQKMVVFLSNDFTLERWRTAAVKNAYVLMSKKDYIMSAAFFLIGGNFKEAVDVVTNNMKDIQLAIMICRMRENLFSRKIEDKPVLKALIEENFIIKGKLVKDPWLVSIGYTMIGQHVNSLNCFQNSFDVE